MGHPVIVSFGRVVMDHSVVWPFSSEIWASRRVGIWKTAEDEKQTRVRDPLRDLRARRCMQNSLEGQCNALTTKERRRRSRRSLCLCQSQHAHSHDQPMFNNISLLQKPIKLNYRVFQNYGMKGCSKYSPSKGQRLEDLQQPFKP